MPNRDVASEGNPPHTLSGPRLRGLMAERGLTRKAVAARVGISERRLHVILREARPGDPGRILRAIAALDPEGERP